MVLTLHGTDIAKSKGTSLQVIISKLVAKRVDRVIVLNDYMEDTLSNIKQKLYRLPCGVDTQVFYPKHNKAKSSSKVLIVFPGNPHRAVKNYPLFKDVTDLLKSKYYLPIFEIVLENLTRQQVCELFNSVDCLLMTSLSEGSPQVIKEAMACNTSIVTTDVGNVRELLAHVDNAKVVSSFDSFKLADAVADILSNDKTRNGRENIFKLGLDKKATSQKLYDLYNELQSLPPPKI
jgi:glycosyltransferase involved in cell wall biosynthesis